MSAITPDEGELLARLTAHLHRRPGNPLVPAVWHGYLAGLLEWGVIDGNAHARLSGFLPKVGAIEMVEVMAGLDYVDAHPELHAEEPGETRRGEQPVSLHAG